VREGVAQCRGSRRAFGCDQHRQRAAAGACDVAVRTDRVRAQVLAPVLAAPLVESKLHYLALYIFAGALALLSGIFVTRIKSVP
jgi:hypothetical protein